MNDKLMYRFCIVMMLCVVLFGVIVVWSRGSRGASRNIQEKTWKSDPAPLVKYIPLLSPFEECLWIHGQVYPDQSRLVPGPNDSYYRGYIKIDSEMLSSLQENYHWAKSDLDLQSIEKPSSETMADSFLQEGTYLESSDFMKAHSSPYCAGRVVLNPGIGIVYFDLQNL